jgi:signal transduction histidine kinase
MARAAGPSRREPGFLDRERSPRRVAAWREAYFYGLLIAAVFVPFDFLYPERLAWTLAARAALVGVLAGCWWLLGRPSRRAASRVVVAGAALAGVITPVTVLVSSGASGARFGFVLSVPFIILALLPEVPGVAALAGLSATVAGGIAMVAEGQRPVFVVEWILMTGAVVGVTSFGSRRIGALIQRAREAERERRDVIAQLEESERRRASSERLALVGRLAAGVGHEINNPLSAVKGNVSCALEELERLDAAPHAREALAEALAASERIEWITADMRALASDAGAPLIRCEVGRTIRDALDRAGQRLRAADVQLSLEPDLPPVWSDPRLLADAITQLTAQAAAARGEELPAAPAAVRISARRVGEGVEIAVDDDGPRIPAHLLPRVFEPFAAQGELRGAGLSLTLPMTREIAERSGGRLRADWHEGGNRYTLTLPAAEE